MVTLNGQQVVKLPANVCGIKAEGPCSQHDDWKVELTFKFVGGRAWTTDRGPTLASAVEAALAKYGKTE
jgi:hypothetical protein